MARTTLKQVEFESFASFPTTWNTNILYIATNTNKIYRWNGSTYVEVAWSSGTWDVTWPASSTDNAVVRFDSTTWKVIQNSTTILDDNWNLSTETYTWTPLSDKPTATFRRNSSSQTSKVLLIQTELNAELASIDKAWNIIWTNLSWTNTWDDKTSVTGILKWNWTAISAATDWSDYLSWTTWLKLDQTTPQTVINWIPIFNAWISVGWHTTFEGVTSTGATGTGKLVYDTSPVLWTPYIADFTNATHNHGSAAQWWTLAIGASIGTQFFIDDTAIIPAGSWPQTVALHTLLKSPSSSVESTDTASVNNNKALLDQYLYNAGVWGTQIDWWEWEFDTYAATTWWAANCFIIHAIYDVFAWAWTITITGSGTSRTATVTGGTPFVSWDANADISLCGYLQTPNWVFAITWFTSSSVVTITTLSTYTNETWVAYSVHRNLFQATSSAFTQNAVNLYSTLTVQPAFTLVGWWSDKLCVRYFAYKNNAWWATISLYQGWTAHYSHFHAPIVIRHNDLAWLQWGTGSWASGQMYHLTSAEYTGTGTWNFVRTTAPTLASTVTIGTASWTTWAALFKWTTSWTVTLSVADAAGTWTMKLPTTAGTNTYLLQTDWSWNTSWVAPPAWLTWWTTITWSSWTWLTLNATSTWLALATSWASWTQFALTMNNSYAAGGIWHGITIWNTQTQSLIWLQIDTWTTTTDQTWIYLKYLNWNFLASRNTWWLSINDYDSSTAALGITNSISIWYNFNKNSSYWHTWVNIQNEQNAWSWSNSWINIQNYSTEYSTTDSTWSWIWIYQYWVWWTAFWIVTTSDVNSSTNGIVNYTLSSSSQSAASVMQKIDLWTTAQWHIGLQILAKGASTSERWITVDMGNTWTWAAIELILGSNWSNTNYWLYYNLVWNNSSNTHYGIYMESLNWNAWSAYWRYVNSIWATARDNSKYFSLNNNQSWNLWSTWRSLDTSEILFSRTHTWTTTLTDNFNIMYLKRTNVVNNASATYNVQWSILKLENSSTNTSSTAFTDTINILSLTQDTDSTWKLITWLCWATERFKVDPLVANSWTNNAYLFDTTTSLSWTTTLWIFANAWTAKFTIDNAWNTLSTWSITTAAPTTWTAAAWKLWSKISTWTSVLDATWYVELDIWWSLYKLALVTNS